MKKTCDFAGATFDPCSSFRAVRVVDFFKQQQLDAQRLQHQYRAQMSVMLQTFLDLDCPRARISLLDDLPVDQRGAFLALRSPDAAYLQDQLYKFNVYTDLRGDVIRFGVAPYTQKHQIQEAFRRLKTIITSMK